MKKKPREGRHVKLKVTVSGTICHAPGQIKRRHVTGQRGREIGLQTKDKGPAETFYSNLNSANINSLKAGNYSDIPSKHALRKMLREIMNDELLDRETSTEKLILLQK